MTILQTMHTGPIRMKNFHFDQTQNSQNELKAAKNRKNQRFVNMSKTEIFHPIGPSVQLKSDGRLMAYGGKVQNHKSYPKWVKDVTNGISNLGMLTKYSIFGL